MLALSLPRSMSKTLRVLAALLAYPDPRMRAHLHEMRCLLAEEDALLPSRREELDALMNALESADPLERESEYVEVFDRGRATSLYLFEHVHGDSRDRGPAMIDLCHTYEAAGLFVAPTELPDYLPVVLEFASTQPPRQARALLAEIAHILKAVFGALRKRNSAYASVFGALIELAGDKPTPIEPAADEALDDSWAEPPVFDGCSVQGQCRPARMQPVHLVRSPKMAAADSNPRSGAAR